MVSKSFIAAIFTSALLSFLKFNHCRLNNWASPDNYIHACYTDIPALFSERGLDTNTFPYLSATNSIEYPPIIGLGNWLISFFTPNTDSHRWFFDINVLLITILYFGCVVIVKKLQPQFTHLFLFAPAVIASLFINWDIWAVITALLAIYFFDQKKFEVSAIWLGVSIATKFFPIVLLLPIAVIFYRNKKVKDWYRYLFTTFIIWAAFNLPIMFFYFDGWWRFYKLNLERSSDFGSIWYGLSLSNINLPSLNLIYLLLSIGLFAAFTFYLIKLRKIPKLSQVALFAVVIFTTVGKVYSPQYVLWLTPLAVIALTNSKQQITFWFWQASEIIYHLAIWQYLALFTGAHFGLPAGGYVIAIALRVVGISCFTYVLMRDLSSTSTGKLSAISR